MIEHQNAQLLTLTSYGWTPARIGVDPVHLLCAQRYAGGGTDPAIAYKLDGETRKHHMRPGQSASGPTGDFLRDLVPGPR